MCGSLLKEDQPPGVYGRWWRCGWTFLALDQEADRNLQCRFHAPGLHGQCPLLPWSCSQHAEDPSMPHQLAEDRPSPF
ncbi:hypothetical protein DPEC_G00244120 [Dallia pectoralis]|uniref:Uncharacterized protein n=1 Tax=Dallia pectoralis TaxID=75939 RepID=A0ACC2FVK5_DALPE|nr:hypothetical protein DPEC_G00244120 [Dallia pectoralis]